MAQILVVDDERDLGELLAMVLELEGHQVRKALDGQAGLARLEEAPLPDLLILDVEMPVLDGPEMAYRMLVHNAGQDRIPIIVLSGVTDVGAVARRLGTPYFLEKPVAVERLLAMVSRALRERVWPHPVEGDRCA